MTSLSEILPGTGLDITVSVEDGLRLSELSGELARTEFGLDHLITTNFWIVIVPIIFGLIVALVLMTIMSPPRPLDPRIRTQCYPNYSSRNPQTMEDSMAASEAGFAAWRRARHRDMIECIIPALLMMAILMVVLYFGARDTLEADAASLRAQMDAILSKYGAVS